MAYISVYIADVFYAKFREMNFYFDHILNSKTALDSTLTRLSYTVWKSREFYYHSILSKISWKQRFH